MIKDFFDYFNKLSSEKVNQLLLFIALLSLVFRDGDFMVSFIPKPFEILFVVIVILTIIDLLINKKIKSFIIAIPKKILVVLFFMIISVFIGWSINIFIFKNQFHIEMVLEFLRLAIALGLFLLILYYAKNKFLAKLYFYALSFSVINIVFLFFYNDSFVTAGRFIGMTNNLNTISKILIIPTIFFTSRVLFGDKKYYFKYSYVVISAFLVALMYWAASRGGLLGLFIGFLFLLFIVWIKKLDKKELVKSISIMLLILMLGFIFTPYSGKQVLLDRVLHKVALQTNYNAGLKEKSLLSIVKNIPVLVFSKNKDDKKIEIVKKPTDPRLGIWSFYLKEIIHNPFGEGPAYNLGKSIFVIDVYVPTDAHSAYLEVLMWGGFTAFFCFIYLLYLSFRKLKENLMKSNFDNNIVALSGMLLSLVVSMAFDSSLKFFWFWALLALSFKEISNTYSSEDIPK